MLNNTVLIIIALKVSFEKPMYSAEEGKVISDIRLKATWFGMKQVIRVKKLVGLPPPALELLGRLS